jgi:hypothetical protein
VINTVTSSETDATRRGTIPNAASCGARRIRSRLPRYVALLLVKDVEGLVLDAYQGELLDWLSDEQSRMGGA